MTLDRIGWALATGFGACAIGAALVAWGSGAGVPTIMLSAIAAGLLAATAIVGLGAPLWWLAGRREQRGPLTAGLIGAGVAAVLTLIVLTRGGGSGPVWASALAMAAVAAFLGALIALAMWLVAYRPD